MSLRPSHIEALASEDGASAGLRPIRGIGGGYGHEHGAKRPTQTSQLAIGEQTLVPDTSAEAIRERAGLLDDSYQDAEPDRTSSASSGDKGLGHQWRSDLIAQP